MSDVAMVGSPKYKRIADDAYFTREPWVTEALIDTATLRGTVWECAAGGGHMANIIAARGYPLWTSDIRDHGYLLDEVVDFLAAKDEFAGSIVTNPPYDRAQEFVERALYLTHFQQGMVAMLLRNEFDCAKSRAKLFADLPAFTMKIVLRKRPRWVEGPQKASPRHNFAWYVWDWQNTHRPQIRWAA